MSIRIINVCGARPNFMKIAPLAAGLLRRAGFEAAVWRTEPDEVPAILRWNRALRWLFHFLRPSFRRARALHVAGAPTQGR